MGVGLLSVSCGLLLCIHFPGKSIAKCRCFAKLYDEGYGCDTFCRQLSMCFLRGEHTGI